MSHLAEDDVQYTDRIEQFEVVERSQSLSQEQQDAMISSYENVYDGVNMEAEEEPEGDMEVGDKFDTRQPDPHLEGMEKSSSFERLYESAQGAEAADLGQGELCGVDEKVQNPDLKHGKQHSTNTAPDIVSSHCASRFSSHKQILSGPIDITVESGLDLLVDDSCMADSVFYGHDQEQMSCSFERSHSCETEGRLAKPDDSRHRHSSTPDSSHTSPVRGIY